MATPAQLKRLEALIWVLIFGGLLGLVYGLALERYEPQAGLGFVAGGSMLAALGVVLILVRARLKSPEREDPRP